MVSPASPITCSTLARLPGWWTVSTMRISGIFMREGCTKPCRDATCYHARAFEESAVAKATGSTPAAQSTPAAKRAEQPAIDPLDLYAVRALLTEEERLVQVSVARLVDELVLPLIPHCFVEHLFPQELISHIAAVM